MPNTWQSSTFRHVNISNFLVSGTGTDVGKTYACAWICHLFPQLQYWKPVQCGAGSFQGLASASDAATVSQIVTNSTTVGIYLNTPASPHFAASLENKTVTLDKISSLCPSPNNLLIEGAGGVAVPLNETEDISQLALTLKIGVLLITRPDLGTLNHTRLSIAYLKAHNIPLLGVLFSTPQEDWDWDDAISKENWRFLASETKVLGSIPFYKKGHWLETSHQVSRQTLENILGS